jgi:hypothetical protein
MIRAIPVDSAISGMIHILCMDGRDDSRATRGYGRG